MIEGMYGNQSAPNRGNPPETPIDGDIIEGWDRCGIHCWSSHGFESLDFIERRSGHIAVVERTLSDGTVSSFNFRRYVNRYGDERFVMVCVDDEDVVFGRKGVDAWLTDGVFFKETVGSMRRAGEIDEADYRILMEACGGEDVPKAVDAERNAANHRVDGTVERIGDATAEWLENLFDGR